MFSWTRTLVGAVSSLIVWALHFVAVYGLAAVGCERGWERWPLAGSNALTVLLIVVTVPALAAIAWIGYGGWRAMRDSASAERHGEIDEEAGRRRRFMGLLTVALAVVAFIATTMTAVPILMLPPCE
jgi:hypothetical protein